MTGAKEERMSEQQADYKTRSKTIFRVEKNADNPFVMIDRRPIENPKLSWRAKGILTYLVSRPDNWIVRLGDLIKRSPDGLYAVRAALKELTKAGHITRKEEREGGRFKQYVLQVHELPLIDLSQAVEPQAVNQMLNDTDSINDTKVKDILDGILEMQLKPKSIQDALKDFFKLTPNWDTKFNRQFMQWAVSENIRPEQIKLAAQVWGKDKRFNWAPPNLKGIQEHWLQLIETSAAPVDDFMAELEAKRARLRAGRQTA
jgi:hypothetical protein